MLIALVLFMVRIVAFVGTGACHLRQSVLTRVVGPPLCFWWLYTAEACTRVQESAAE